MAPRSSASFTFALVVTLLFLLVCMPSGSDAKTCVFQCMRNVITCKRKAALMPGGSGACCDAYYKCFLDCKPDADVLPP